MDSAEFLDLLGNANRRRILRLLSRKPCYVTEISEYLGVSPKAVIDHLRKLEEAGLVESRTDERRRKYFSISRHVRLEVTVSPYEFGTKSAYPASSALDITSWSRLTIEVDDHDDSTDDEDVDPAEAAELARRLDEFERLDDELSMAQRWTHGRISRLRDQLAETVEVGDPRLLSELLVTLADGASEVEHLAGELEAPPPIVEDMLEDLATKGVVTRTGRRWELDEPA